MGNNKLYGSIPPSVAALPNLDSIDLSQNRLTGTLPPFTSSQLRIINLGINDLHGSIPKKFITAKKTCEEISMPQNRLSGSLPDSLFELINVDKIDLSSNLLHGTLPDSMGNLVLLQHLQLNNNFLVGSVPQTLASSHPINGKMGDLLETIHLQDNQLSGEIPVNLSDLPKLKELIIHENKLTGQVPADICSATINAFFFQGTVATSDRNYCDAISCPADTVAMEGTYPCTGCNNVYYNPYVGQTRTCNTLVNQREILVHFYESTSENGGVWKGENNWQDDRVFLCDFTGITCDENFHVTGINLGGRGLKGTIPDELGFLQYLETLNLSDNELAGFLPSDLRWAPLTSIDISGNNIRGTVAPKLCLKAGVNGNGLNGDYNCHNIACPVGTFSPSGRQDASRNHKCQPCQHNNPEVLGYKSCQYVGVASGLFGFVVALVTLALAAAVIVLARMQRKRRMEHNDVLYQLEMQQPMTRSPNGTSVDEDRHFAVPSPATGRRYTATVAAPPTPGRAVQSQSRQERRKAYSEIPNDESATSSQLPYPEAETPRRNAGVSGGRSVQSGNSADSDMWLDVPKLT